MTSSGFASSKAEKLADDLGLDASQIVGTGKDNAVTVADVEAAAPDMPNLGEAGRAHWRSVVNTFDLDDRELEILALAARQADDLALLEQAIREDGGMSVGSAGQPIVHPAIQEARQARLAIGRLHCILNLPVEDEHGTEASTRGRKAAQARWRNRGTRGAA